MFDKNTILKELDNGKSFDDIAAQITQALNDAQKEYKEKNEAKAVRDKNLGEWIIATDKLLGKDYPYFANIFTKLSTDELEKLLESFQGFDIKFWNEPFGSGKKYGYTAEKKAIDDKDFDTLEKWLKRMGL